MTGLDIENDDIPIPFPISDQHCVICLSAGGAKLKSLSNGSSQETNKNHSDAYLSKAETNQGRKMLCSSYVTDVENLCAGVQCMSTVISYLDRVHLRRT